MSHSLQRTKTAPAREVQLMNRYGPPRLKSIIVSALAFLILGSCTRLEPLAEPVRENVEFKSLSLPGRLWEPFMPPAEQGTEVTVNGTLVVPATQDRVPGIVITHGCGGISSGESRWARELENLGVATLLVDSFSGRGVEGICSGTETVNIASMLVDAYRAAELLRDDPYVDGSRVGIMGLSFGGRTALWSSMRRFQQRYEGEPFDLYLALYPASCYITLEGETDVAGGPIRVFHGDADDWLPVEQCRPHIDALRRAGVDAELTEYPGAHHGFDNYTVASAMTMPDVLSPRHCTFVEHDGTIIDIETGQPATIHAPCVESGASIGYNPEAAEKLTRDIEKVLAGVFG